MDLTKRGTARIVEAWGTDPIESYLLAMVSDPDGTWELVSAEINIDDDTALGAARAKMIADLEEMGYTVVS